MLNILLTCLIWGLIGYAVALPVLLAQAVYNINKLESVYDVHGVYYSRYRRHRRDAKFYGAANFALVLMLVILATN